MDPRYAANTMSTPTSGSSQYWRFAQPADVYQTPWPCFLIALPYDGMLPGPLHLANGVSAPPQVSYRRRDDGRKFVLDRSLFELVAAHPYLALTDTRLLGWYLRLSPEDKKVIQGEGGLYKFLHRHPALELSKHHVYVKGNCSVQPATTSNPAGITYFSGNMEPESCRQRQIPEFSSRLSENSPLQSTFQNESSPECYSLGSIHIDGATSNDGSITESAELKDITSPRRLVEENDTKERSLCDVVGCNYATVDDDDDDDDDDDYNEANLCLEDQSDNFRTITEEDESILVCAASGQKSVVATNGEELATSSETMTSEQTITGKNAAEKSTSPVPRARTCDIMLGTEQTLCVSAFTQTDEPRTVDKHIVTEVHMADLDYIAAEFIRLQTSQEELKDKLKNSGCKLREECDCIQRAQRAELNLLALQYIMCRQHCWRLYYTSAEGDQRTPLHGDLNTYWPKDPPANILNVMQKLTSDYIEMRGKILGGVPLEHLKPLSVDSEKMTTAVSSYIPAQIAGDLLGNVLSWSSHETRRQTTSGDRSDCSDDGTNDCQSKAKQIKKNNKKGTAVTLLAKNRGANHDAFRLLENPTAAVCKEPATREAWYAKEDLESVGPAAATELGQNANVTENDMTHESANEEAESSVCKVSTLAQNMTESDAMGSSEKYQTSEVSISAVNNDSRPPPAKVAERELQGFPLNMEHNIHGDIAGSQGRSSSSLCVFESPQDDPKPQTPNSDTNNIAKMFKTPLPFGTSIKNMTRVSFLPMAKGTYIPQHYGTMGSFDTLMAELTQCHPDVGRQKIVDALVELRDKHQGVLSGLPLRTIGEMVSELLGRSAAATQL